PGRPLASEDAILRRIARQVLPERLAAPRRLLEGGRFKRDVLCVDLELFFHGLGSILAGRAPRNKPQHAKSRHPPIERRPVTTKRSRPGSGGMHPGPSGGAPGPPPAGPGRGQRSGPGPRASPPMTGTNEVARLVAAVLITDAT